MRSVENLIFTVYVSFVYEFFVDTFWSVTSSLLVTVKIYFTVHQQSCSTPGDNSGRLYFTVHWPESQSYVKSCGLHSLKTLSVSLQSSRFPRIWLKPRLSESWMMRKLSNVAFIISIFKLHFHWGVCLLKLVIFISLRILQKIGPRWLHIQTGNNHLEEKNQ